MSMLRGGTEQHARMDGYSAVAAHQLVIHTGLNTRLLRATAFCWRNRLPGTTAKHARVCPHTEPTAACIGVQSTHLLLRVADVEDGTEARPLLLKREGKEQEDRERGRAGYMD